MAVIYLKHELHGAKVATMEEEAIYDETNGWVRYTLDTEDIPADEPNEAVNAMAPEKRRGRPPKGIVA